MLLALCAWFLAGVARAAEPDRAWPWVDLVLIGGELVQGELVGSKDGHFYVLLPSGQLQAVPFEQVAELHRLEPEPSLSTPEPVEVPAPRRPLESLAVPAPDFGPVAASEPVERSFLGSGVAPVDSSPMPADTEAELSWPSYELELETAVLAGVGLRGRVVVQRGLVHAVNLRVGVAASPIAYQTDTEQRRFLSTKGTRLGLYLLPSLELPRAGATLELSAGPALFPLQPLHSGVAVGAAFRGTIGEHLGSKLGVLWFTDLCGREPFLVLDVGPTWRW